MLMLEICTTLCTNTRCMGPVISICSLPQNKERIWGNQEKKERDREKKMEKDSTSMWVCFFSQFQPIEMNEKIRRTKDQRGISSPLESFSLPRVEKKWFLSEPSKKREDSLDPNQPKKNEWWIPKWIFQILQIFQIHANSPNSREKRLSGQWWTLNLQKDDK